MLYKNQCSNYQIPERKEILIGHGHNASDENDIFFRESSFFSICQKLSNSYNSANIKSFHCDILNFLNWMKNDKKNSDFLSNNILEMLLDLIFKVTFFERIPLVDKQICLEILTLVFNCSNIFTERYVNSGIIPKLISLLNNDKYQQVFGSIILCIASIVKHCEKCQDKVIFNLSYLNCLQVHSKPIRINCNEEEFKIHNFKYEEENDCDVEFVPFKKDLEAQREFQEAELKKHLLNEEEDIEENKENKEKSDLKLIGDEPAPGILPPDDNQNVKYINEDLPSLSNLEYFLKYVDKNGDTKIYMPIFKLFYALINKNLNHCIARFIAFETCFNISSADESDLLELLKILQKITVLDKDIWESIFAQSELYSKVFISCIQIQNENTIIPILNLISEIYSKKARIYNIPANDKHLIFCFCVDSLSASDERQEIRLNASKAINSILYNNCNIQEMLKCNLLQVTCRIFDECNYNVKFNIVSYLSHIALYGTRNDKYQLIKMNFIKMFVDILEYCNENLMYLSLKSLNELLSFSTQINQKSMFCEQFESCVSNFFYELPNHYNKCISNISSYFLQNYIDNDEDDDSPLFSF